jgi:hypothetical protein
MSTQSISVPTALRPGTRRMALDNVRKGRIDAPLRVLLHGVEGVGKSTFASHAPAPIFVGADQGTGELDVARFPEPQAWDDVLEAVRILEHDAHDYKTVVLDPLNWLEALCWQHTSKANGWKSLDEPGYGIGYNAALDTWRVLLAALDRLWSTRQMNIVLLAHSTVKQFKNPEGEDYDRYQLAMNDKAAGLWKQWSDVVLFAKHETATVKDTKTKRARGISTGAREMFTCWNAAYDAKNRQNLPEKMPLSWDEFYEAASEKDRKVQADEVRQRIDALLTAYGDDAFKAKAIGFVAAANNDASRLRDIENRILKRVNETKSAA